MRAYDVPSLVPLVPPRAASAREEPRAHRSGEHRIDARAALALSLLPAGDDGASREIPIPALPPPPVFRVVEPQAPRPPSVTPPEPRDDAGTVVIELDFSRGRAPGGAITKSKPPVDRDERLERLKQAAEAKGAPPRAPVAVPRPREVLGLDHRAPARPAPARPALAPARAAPVAALAAPASTRGIAHGTAEDASARAWWIAIGVVMVLVLLLVATLVFVDGANAGL